MEPASRTPERSRVVSSPVAPPPAVYRVTPRPLPSASRRPDHGSAPAKAFLAPVVIADPDSHRVELPRLGTGNRRRRRGPSLRLVTCGVLSCLCALAAASPRGQATIDEFLSPIEVRMTTTAVPTISSPLAIGR